MPDAQDVASDRVDSGAISRAIVGEQLLDDHAVTLEERDCAPEERDDGRGLFVGQDLGVSQARAVIDGDMHVLPAHCVAPAASCVDFGGVVVRVRAAANPLPGAALYAP